MEKNIATVYHAMYSVMNIVYSASKLVYSPSLNFLVKVCLAELIC